MGVLETFDHDDDHTTPMLDNPHSKKFLSCKCWGTNAILIVGFFAIIVLLCYIATLTSIMIFMNKPACNCDPIGSLNPSCDSKGTCYCKSGYYGRKCSQSCNCDCNGSSCSSDGTCNCKYGYTGSKCESCQSGYKRSDRCHKIYTNDDEELCPPHKQNIREKRAPIIFCPCESENNLGLGVNKDKD